MKKLMVVVGTTNFDDLITRIDNEEILKTFISYGYTKIVFQIGKFKSFFLQKKINYHKRTLLSKKF